MRHVSLIFALAVGVFAADQADAQRFRLFRRQPVRTAARRVVQVPVRIVQRTAEAARNTVEAVTPLRFDRRVRDVTFDGDPARACTNSKCDCESCDCIDCDCGEETPALGAASNISSREQRMVAAINRYRASHGKPPLEIDDTLMRIARQRCPAFNHYQPRHGGWVHQQLARLGFVATDNIAQGYESPESAVGDSRSGWGDARPGHTVGHDRQMLGYIKRDGAWRDMEFDRVGVAVDGRNYIAIFGKRT